MKRQVSVIICILCLLILPLSVYATYPYVVDEAGLLTANEAASLETSCQNFYATSGMELIFLTVNNLGGKSAMAYADDYYEMHYGENGILLLIAMSEREWYISTTGTAIEAFSNADLENMENGFIKYLSDGNYYMAFQQFLSDSEYYWCDEEVSDLDASLFIAFPSGAVIALIVLLALRSSMHTKKAQHGAASYEVEGSYNLRRHQDLFLYSKMSKREKPQQNSNSGSTTHTSSSGRSHGGRGGNF